MVWLLLASREPRLAAAVPFYGPFPENGNLTGSKAAVLGIYAELDFEGRRQSFGGGGGAARRRLAEPDRDVPASITFFKPELAVRPRAAASAAYRRIFDWFSTHLAT